jgi:hypothetical protein
MVAGGLEIDLLGDLAPCATIPQFGSATGRMHAFTATMLC